MSWLSSFVKHNRGFIGNAVKNLSPALAFTPLGILGAGAAGALGRAIQPGAKLGDIVKSGVSNAAIGGGVRGGVSALRSVFAPSSSAAGTLVASGEGAGGAGSASAAGSAPSAFTSGVDTGSGGWMGDTSLGRHAVDAATGGSSGLGGFARSVGSFAKDNPNAIAGGFQGLASLGSMGAENDYKRAQTNALNTNTAMSQAELDDRKRRAELMEPILRALMGNRNAMSVAPNPYTSVGG